MQFKLDGSTLVVTREQGDKKYYGVHHAMGESALLHDIKTELNKRGFDLIKKRMWKDGHLVDDLQQYLRTRSVKSKSPHIYLSSFMWAMRGLNEDFNNGEVAIGITFDVFSQQSNCAELMKQLLR